MANTDAPLGVTNSGPPEAFEAHRRGYLDAMHHRPYPPEYETWDRALALNYELGRARLAELRGLRGKGVRWREGETSLKQAMTRLLGAQEAERFSRESLALFNEAAPP
jgi:hypothetical protein